MFEKIRDRYLRYYVTDAQLDRYVALSVLTEEQAESIRQARKLEDNSSGGGVKFLIPVPAGGLSIRLPGGAVLVLTPEVVA